MKTDGALLGNCWSRGRSRSGKQEQVQASLAITWWCSLSEQRQTHRILQAISPVIPLHIIPYHTPWLTWNWVFLGIPYKLQTLLPDNMSLFLFRCSSLFNESKEKATKTSSPAPSFSPVLLRVDWLLPEGKALQSGTYHLSWLPAQQAGHPQQPRERAGISLGPVPALPDRAREVEIAMFVEVAEGGAEGPPHGAEQVSVQDKGCPQLTAMFASPISSCLDTQLMRCCSALSRRKAALGNTFAM